MSTGCLTRTCWSSAGEAISEFTTISVIGSFTAVIWVSKCCTIGNLPVGMR
jgi:hypothetical protein